MTNEWASLADKAKDQVTKNEVLNPVVADLVKKHVTGAALFDYGCGWGEFAQLMSDEGFAVTAFDEADEMVEAARSKHRGPVFLYKADFLEQLPNMATSFDVVTSNLVLCILEPEDQAQMLANVKELVRQDGLIVLSFCHPKYDFLPDSLVSTRMTPSDAQYEDTFVYEKEIKENGFRFHDYHRPLEYYLSLFAAHGLRIIDQRESSVMDTSYKPDFIVFALSRN